MACSYEGTLGTPALFDASLFEAIGALEGDAGAKPIILGQGEAALTIEAPGAAIDIDTDEDLLRLTGADNQ